MTQNGDYGESIEEYDVLGLLGKGGFATVYRARSKRNNQMVAIKMIDKKLIHSAGLTNRVRQEVEIHSRLKHPFVVELYTFFQDSDYVYLVMELASNGELQRYMKEHICRPMTEIEAAAILHQVVSGILYLHSHSIMHRDISLSNLLLSKNMNVKIADFGLAAQLKQTDEKHLTMCGTPNFISPEVASRSSHGLPADVWAIGCLLYTLLVGRPPFDTHAVQATLTKVVMSDFSLPDHLSFEAKDLINRLLKKDPNERIALQNIPKHSFMHRYLLPAAAAGTVAITNTGSMSENFNTAALMQASAAAGYNYKSNASCDSGIITFSSTSTASSLKPTLSSCGVLEQHSRDFHMRTDENLSAHQTPYKSNNVQTYSNDIDWLPKKCVEQPQWQPMSQCKMTNSNGAIAVQANEIFSMNCNRLGELKSFTSQQQQQSSSPMIAGIPTATPVTSTHTLNSTNKQEQHLSVPPLNTERLQPTRFRNKSAVMSILNGGEVVVEFIKFRGKLNEDRITDVCWISKDGQRIVIYEPDPGRGLPILDEPPELPQHDTRVGIFSYDNLPNKHWRKYLFASRFVSLVKASTPKVTYFSDQAKFHLMESMMHFEAIFYDGSKVTQSPNEGLKIYDRHGRLLQPQEHTSSTATALLAHQATCLRHCEAICRALELVQHANEDGSGCTCFPVVIGRRPNKDRIGRFHENANAHDRQNVRLNKLTTTATTSQTTTTNDILPYTFNGYPNTPISNNNNNIGQKLLSQCENDNARPVRATILPDICKATELSNGIVQVQFYDGTTISVDSNSTTRAGSRGGITYMQSNGISTYFAPHDDLPQAVREKLLHLPTIEEQLKNTNISSSSAGYSAFSCGDNGSYFSTPASIKSPRVYTSTPAIYTHDRFEGNCNSQNTQAMRYFR